MWIVDLKPLSLTSEMVILKTSTTFGILQLFRRFFNQNRDFVPGSTVNLNTLDANVLYFDKVWHVYFRKRSLWRPQKYLKVTKNSAEYLQWSLTLYGSKTKVTEHSCDPPPPFVLKFCPRTLRLKTFGKLNIWFSMLRKKSISGHLGWFWVMSAIKSCALLQNNFECIFVHAARFSVEIVLEFSFLLEEKHFPPTFGENYFFSIFISIFSS